MPMRVRRRSILALSLVCGLASLAPAGEHAVTLRQAERLALEHNQQIRIAEDSVRKAQAQITQARANMLPSASASGTYTRNVELPVFFAPAPIGKIEMGEKNTYSLSLTAGQPLFLGFAGLTGYRLAQTAARNTELQLDKSTQSVIQGVREAYLGAVLARTLVEVQAEALARAEANLEQVERQHSVGAVSRFDLVRARVQTATTRPALVSATSAKELADAALRTAIGLRPGSRVTPVDTLATFTSRWQSVSYDSLLLAAYRYRPDIRQSENLQRTAGYGVRLAQSRYYPAAAAFGSMQWQAQDPAVVPDNFVRSSMIGVQFTWTLWDSWRTPASVQSARVGVRQVNAVNRLMRDGVALEVEVAYRKLHEAAANVESGAETVALAAEALRLAEVLYDAGGSTQLDVISSQLALTLARTQYAQALYTYHMAHTQMEKALGLVRPEGDTL